MSEIIEITFEDLATIIGGLYCGLDVDIEKTEDLIDYLNENEGQSAFIQKVKPENQEVE